MSKTILRALEYHGRLLEPDGSPVPAGRYSVRFSLHSDQRGQRTSWVETQHDIDIGRDGAVAAVLGLEVPIDPKLFDGRTRWVGARLLRRGQADEAMPRTRIVGTTLMLTKLVERHAARLDTLEENQRILRAGPTKEKLKQRLDEIATRLERLEIGEVTRLSRLIDQLLDRVDAVDEDGGRLVRIEDEIEDLCGPDGDIVDVNERMDGLEKRALRVLEHTEAGPDRYEAVVGRIDKLEEAPASSAEAAGPGDTEQIDALPLAGGELAGGLTIQKGGLNVASGDITGNQVKVFSVTASNAVRARRLVAEEQLEIRGEITADNTQRAIQIRKIEGRNGSAKKDGPLHLNSRGGHEVIVGNKASAAGLQVHGPVKCAEVRTKGKDLAERFDGEPVEPGCLVRMDGGRRVVVSDTAFDTRVVGVVSSQPGISLGDGEVPVALQGTAPCKVVGPVELGDLLVPSEVPGHAMAAGPERTRGCLVGKAMEELSGGTGMILVLLS
ncbi:MAG TPA: hypothetical protein QGF58_07835 [Myxococcota bacterium]|nr:hypothetical protein [Myxococcota bacterium]